MGGSSSTWRRPRLIYHGREGCGQMPRCNSPRHARRIEFRNGKGLARYRSGNATIIPSSAHCPSANRSQLAGGIIKIVSYRSYWSVFARQAVSDGVYDLRRPLCARGRGIAVFGPPCQRARRLPSAPGADPDAAAKTDPAAGAWFSVQPVDRTTPLSGSAPGRPPPASCPSPASFPSPAPRPLWIEATGAADRLPWMRRQRGRLLNDRLQNHPPGAWHGILQGACPHPNGLASRAAHPCHPGGSVRTPEPLPGPMARPTVEGRGPWRAS